MKEIKSVGNSKIFEKKSGRYAVKNKDKQYINGDEKEKILVKEGLVKIEAPKAKPTENAVNKDEAKKK